MLYGFGIVTNSRFYITFLYISLFVFIFLQKNKHSEKRAHDRIQCKKMYDIINLRLLHKYNRITDYGIEN